MTAVLVPVEEAELIHVALVRTGVGACLRGHLKTSGRTVALKLLNSDRCLSQIQDALTQGGVCVERVLQPVGVYRSRFLTGLLWDWMPGGSLHSLLYETPLDLDLPLVLRLRILLDVAEGLNVLHAVSLPHGALKTTNVLLDHQYRAKLCDWGQQTSVDAGGRENGPSVRADVYSFGVLMWETLNRRPPCESFDQLQNLIMRAQGGAELGVEVNLLPPDAPQSHALSRIMTRCWCLDPKQRPLAEECVLELRKVLETLDPGAQCAAVQLIRSCKERALLSCKHSPDWELPLELNNLQGHSGCTSPKYAMSKSIPVTAPCWSRHPARAHRPDETIQRGSPSVPTLTRASPPTPCCRGVSSHTPPSSSGSNPGVGRCAEVWAVHPTGASTPPNTPCGSPTSPVHTPLHPAHQPACPVSLGWTCCRLLQKRREAIVQFMTEGRLNNLLDVLRARRAVTREEYELITAAMTLSERTRCLLDTCACLGEKVAVLVATTLGLVSLQTANGHARSRVSPKGQAG